MSRNKLQEFVKKHFQWLLDERYDDIIYGHIFREGSDIEVYFPRGKMQLYGLLFNKVKYTDESRNFRNLDGRELLAVRPSHLLDDTYDIEVVDLETNESEMYTLNYDEWIRLRPGIVPRKGIELRKSGWDIFRRNATQFKQHGVTEHNYFAFKTAEIWIKSLQSTLKRPVFIPKHVRSQFAQQFPIVESECFTTENHFVPTSENSQSEATE